MQEISSTEGQGISRAQGRYSGSAGELFKLALVTGFLTLITLGIYRFWAKTRIRRYIWSSTELEGTRFEYTGTGLEKFLGFLIAVVILAIYLGIFQMLLFFFGFSLFEEPEDQTDLLVQIGLLYLSLLAILPLLYFAIYRARRYKLARTRWRGIRFGMDQGAWGYSFRAMGYGLLTIVSFGLLMPLATFRLEKYMTDRSWFGDGRFAQEGRWQGLYPAMKHLFIGVALLAAGVAAGFLEVSALAAILGVAAYIWIIVGGVYYTIHSFRYLTGNKTLNGEITFVAQPTTATVILTYVGGAIVMGVLLLVAFAILAAAVGVGTAVDMESFDAPGIGTITVGAVGYLVILVGAGAGWLAMVVQPIIAHYVDTLTVENTEAFAAIAQRASDTGADAEGFADALDIGGAI